MYYGDELLMFSTKIVTAAQGWKFHCETSKNPLQMSPTFS